MAELFRAHRTWSLTLTCSHVVAYGEVQAFLKRLRKNTRENFRFFATEERGGQNGRIHWHLLVHCRSKVPKELIRAEWPHGFTHIRLVSHKAGKLARYLAKYSAKNGRFRASIRYGSSDLSMADSALLRACAEHFPDARVEGYRMDSRWYGRYIRRGEDTPPEFVPSADELAELREVELELFAELQREQQAALQSLADGPALGFHKRKLLQEMVTETEGRIRPPPPSDPGNPHSTSQSIANRENRR